MIKRHYATLTGPDGPWQIHLRRGGTGRPMILLHPSPLSSAFLEPLARRLAARFDCIAPDTPGYGLSDPLPSSWSETDLSPYVRALVQLLDALAIDRALVYGSATGAQIALEFAKSRRERCEALLLESVALFTAAERDEIARRYFPDVTPSRDGRHLPAIWDMARRSGRFFPWYDTSENADRRGEDPPLAVTEAMMRDHLLAGPDYDRAYRAAFANENLQAFAGLEVPTRIVQWEDSILGPYARRLEEAELPDCVALRRAGPGMPARMDTVEQAAAELLQPLERCRT